MNLFRAAVISLLALTPMAASATTFSVSYAGVGEDSRYINTAGSGFIDFNGVGTLGLANLTGFSFSQTTTLTDPGLMGAGSFSYGLADVLGFTATYDGKALTALTLRTRTTDDPSGFLASESFRIRSLRVNGATTAFDDAGTDTATVGTVRVAAVPEAATWAMLILGIGATGSMLRRRRSAATQVVFAA